MFSLFEEKVLKNEKAKKWMLVFSYFLNMILSEIDVNHYFFFF